MIGRKAEFDLWCKDIRARYERMFNIEPKGAPNLVNLESEVQERMMRCGVEARVFDLDDNRDDLAILAHHTLLADDMKYLNGTNNKFRLYGCVLTEQA
jgi:hypothetical protein